MNKVTGQMRSMGCLAVLCGMVLVQPVESAGPVAPNWNALNPVTRLSRATFAHPKMTDWPWVRLNMPASADPKELMSEVSELKQSGVAGIEVGQGAFPNDEQLVAILTRANELGLKVSLSHGPTQYPDGYSIDDDNARKTLAFGNVTVEPGGSFDGSLPAPRPPPVFQFPAPPGAGRNPAPVSPPAVGPQPRSTLVAVLAFRCSSPNCAGDQHTTLDPSSAVDLTDQVTGKNTSGVRGGTTAGSLHWSAPKWQSKSSWQIIAFWARGVFAQPDPFSAAGFEQLVHSLDSGLSPKVRALMRVNGGDIFYDSHTADRGSPDELWTNDLAQEFQSRTGYSLISRLPALFPDSFAFSDGSAARVRNDLYVVRGDLWINTQLNPLKDWIHEHHYALRLQPEGEMSTTVPISDQVQITSILDRPEHESLFTNDEVDNYLPIASANHMTGNTWYSTECCAALNMNYAQTLQDVTIRMHRSYAGGIVKIVYHVYPYRASDTSKWPGYHNFGQAGFSNAWGPRDPDWIDAKQYNDYFARVAQVLTQGSAKVDVAVYMQNYLYPQPQMVEGGRGFRIWRDTALQEAGYTRDYLDPEMLARDNATVSNGRLAAAGPAYKVLVIDSELQPATDPDKRSMPVATAERILGYAQSGLPVLIVGSPPDHVPGDRMEDDPVLKQVIAKLLAEPSVSRVDHEADVPAKLQALGILPSAQTATPGPLLSVRRHDEASGTDYYFLYDEGVVSPKGEPANLFAPATGAPLHTEVSLEGRGEPYLLDAWAGTMTPIAKFHTHGNRTIVDLDLVRDDATVIALSEHGHLLGVPEHPIYVVATSADGANRQGDALYVRAMQSGTYTTTLSNGRSVQSIARDVAGPLDLTAQHWKVSAEDWQPANPYATTTGVAATETLKRALHFELQGLKPWSDIPELQYASGIAEYATTFDLPSQWSKSDGAILTLGSVSDSFELSVNGRKVPIDQLSAQADIGTDLKPGTNTLVVRVATTLNNRLAAIDPDVRARGLIQPYGLMGPVILRPYRQMQVFPLLSQPRQ
jgi:hypothetical protein